MILWSVEWTFWSGIWSDIVGVVVWSDIVGVVLWSGRFGVVYGVLLLEWYCGVWSGRFGVILLEWYME